MNVLGLDPGIANTGAARLTHQGRLDTWHLHRDPLPTDTSPADTAARIHDVIRWATGRATTTTTLVLIEELPYAIGAHGGRDQRAAVLWSVTGALARAGLPVAHVNPTTLKQRITGNGRASKAEIRAAIAKLYPRQGLTRITPDEADAAGLATLGVARLAHLRGLPWRGPWLNAQSLNLEDGFRWPTELQSTPAERPKPPLPMFEVPR
ncbi:MAG: crossover junction endodeoxyribonuclease RuvC [Pseudonocardia sp.]|nr:crossover junction endodeoxyribonuclease RuvC [Pseudonocardia sp.]